MEEGGGGTQVDNMFGYTQGQFCVDRIARTKSGETTYWIHLPTHSHAGKKKLEFKDIQVIGAKCVD